MTTVIKLAQSPLQSTYLSLPRNHPIQKGLQSILEIIHPLLFEPRHLQLDQLGAVIKLVLGIQGAALGLCKCIVLSDRHDQIAWRYVPQQLS